jgi:hypothetical protein
MALITDDAVDGEMVSRITSVQRLSKSYTDNREGRNMIGLTAQAAAWTIGLVYLSPLHSLASAGFISTILITPSPQPHHRHRHRILCALQQQHFIDRSIVAMR